MSRMTKIASVLAVCAVAAVGGYFYGRGPQPGLTVPVGQAAKKSSYTCPMHPFVVKDRPGACPVCGMELVPQGKGTELTHTEMQGLRHVAISPTQQVMANLATTAVTLKPFTRQITCTGVVAYNQERQGKVSAWVAGRIDSLRVKSVGSEVRKDRPVAELFSADLYNAQVQYLVAYKTLKVLNSSASVTFPINTQMSLGETSERLRQLGFRQEQFDRLHAADKPNVTVPIYSPLSGIVTEKLVKEGQFVNIGEPLFTIADLSVIWVELELFEHDFPLVRVGQEVAIHSRSYPDQTFHGKVKLIYPFLDPKTRTVKLRVELPNPGLKLKPDMYVQATINVPQQSALLIPAGAVMDTGTRQVVWVESGPGVFVQREVKIGGRSGGQVQVLSGLKVGEKVAVSGGYLIDSEAQLSRSGPEPDRPAAAPEPKGEMDMKDMKMN